MKKTLRSLILLCLAGALLLAGCQTPGALASTPASQPAALPTPIPLLDAAQPADTPTTAAVDAPAPVDPTPVATTTSDSATAASAAAASATAASAAAASAAAVKTVQAYFAALQARDYQAAASYLSIFSLSVDGMTRGDGADELHRKMDSGATWSNLQVKDSQTFYDKGILVHVTYTLTAPDAKTGQSTAASLDELWPVRFENGQWRVNRNNLIDIRTLSIPYQTMGGLRVKPLQLSRYTDRISLTLLVQNTTNEAIVLGQPNEIMAAFSFKGQQVEAVKKQLIFDRLRSYSAVTIEASGLFVSYPEGVIIRQWKNLKVAPWFDFRFSE